MARLSGIVPPRSALIAGMPASTGPDDLSHSSAFNSAFVVMGAGYPDKAVSLRAMSQDADALAGAQVSAVRDDPAARVALMARVFRGPTGRAPRHLPFRRAALSFMRWQAGRGLLNPLGASPPGSPWWRAVDERLLRDGCETVALLGGSAGEPSSHAVRLWLEFGARPAAATGTGRQREHRRPDTWSTGTWPRRRPSLSDSS